MSVFSGLLDLFGEDADFFGGKTADVRGRGAGQIALGKVCHLYQKRLHIEI